MKFDTTNLVRIPDEDIEKLYDHYPYLSVPSYPNKVVGDLIDEENETYEFEIAIRGMKTVWHSGPVNGDEAVFVGQDDLPSLIPRCAECGRYMDPSTVGDELPEERVCDTCANVEADRSLKRYAM